MGSEYQVKRYNAYLRGFCQAFGEHEAQFEPDNDVNWLLAAEQVGLILSADVKRVFHRGLLGRRAEVPTLKVTETFLQLGDSRLSLSGESDRQGLHALRQLIQHEKPMHLYLTYHFTYPAGTRIVTFSKNTPLPIIYKEMRPVKVLVGGEDG